MFERMGKIKEWLESQNYCLEQCCTDKETDTYKVSDGRKIMAKRTGAPSFTLYADDGETILVKAKSQKDFLEKIRFYFPFRVKSLNEIKGFDDVGIGVIWQDEGKGDYILCRDLKGHSLEGVQIYRYSMYRMYKVDNADDDDRVYCVRRKDIQEKEKA